VVSVSVTSVQTVLQKKAMVLPMLKKKSKKILDLLTLGFTYELVNGNERPQCVVCGEILASDI
jgi:hypothetical protein